MFKKLKDKIAEEVKISPQRIQQLQQFTQSMTDKLQQQPQLGGAGGGGGVVEQEPHADDGLFSIGDDPQPHDDAAGFTNVTLHASTPARARRNSNSSVASDVSFLPRYESSIHSYHLQSDMEASASELEDNISTHSASQLGHVSKEQVHSAFQKAQMRYHKYRGRYTDLAAHYRELERDNAKMRAVLVETQDKAIRRVAELREQCQLGQRAKADLEAALRTELEEKAIVVDSLKQKVDLLQTTPPPTNGTASSEVELEELREKLQEMKANSIVAKEQISTLQREVADAEERERGNNLKFAKSKLELHTELQNRELEIANLKRDLDTARTDLDVYEGGGLKAQNTNLIEKYEALQVKCREAEGELLKVEAIKLAQKKHLEELEQKDSRLKQLEMDVEEKDQRLKQLEGVRDEKEGLERRMEEMRADRDMLQVQTEQLLEELNAANRLIETSKESAEQAVAELKATHEIDTQKLQEDAIKLEARWKLLEEEENKLVNREKQQALIKKSLVEETERIAVATKNLDEEENRLEGVKNTLEVERVRLEVTKQHLEENQSKLEATKKELEDLEKNQSETLVQLTTVHQSLQADHQKLATEHETVLAKLYSAQTKQRECEELITKQHEQMKQNEMDTKEVKKQLEEVTRKFNKANETHQLNIVSLEEAKLNLEEDVHDLRLKLQTSQDHLQTATVQLNDLQASEDQCKSHREELRMLQNTQEEVFTLRKSLESHQKQTVELMERLESLQMENQMKTLKLDQLEVEKKENEDLYGRLREELETLQQFQKESENLQEDIKRLQDAAETYHDAAQDYQAQIGFLEEEKRTLQAEHEEMQQKLAAEEQITTADFLKTIERLQDEQVALEQRNQALAVDNKRLLDDYDNLLTESSELKLQLATRINNTDMEVAQKLAEVTGKYTDAVEEASKAKSELSLLQNALETFETTKARFEQQMGDLEKHVSELEQERQFLKDEIEELKTTPLNITASTTHSSSASSSGGGGGGSVSAKDVEQLQMKLAQYKSIDETNRSSIEFYEAELEKLHSKNEKLNRKLDETLVTLNHCADLSSASTEVEYLRNVLYNYMLGKESVVLARVIAAVCKFDRQQTEAVLKHEQHKQSLLGQLGIL